MGGARNRSFISAHFLLSAYFVAAQTYKRMRLITRVYGIYAVGCVSNQTHGPWLLAVFTVCCLPE